MHSSTSFARASTSPSASVSWRIHRSSPAASRRIRASSAPLLPISTSTALQRISPISRRTTASPPTPSMCGGSRARRGDTQIHPHGNVRSDSGEFIRELVLAGVGIGLLSTWDIGPALRSGALRVVLPEYRGAVERRRACGLPQPRVHAGKGQCPDRVPGRPLRHASPIGTRTWTSTRCARSRTRCKGGSAAPRQRIEPCCGDAAELCATPLRKCDGNAAAPAVILP